MRALRKSTYLSHSRLTANRVRHNTTATPTPKSLTSVLIANRGEIALRVGRTASQYGIKTTTLYTDPDARSQHALSSPYAVNLGDPSAYLDGDRIIKIAQQQGCQGIHPGYGFLSENPTFARKCTEAGLIFIGPPWQAIKSMGSKSESKDIMNQAGVRCIPGYHGSNQDPDYLQSEARKIGYPVLLKAVKGGGGKGMRIVNKEAEFLDQLASAKSEARNSFGDEVMLVEKYITTPRHIEVQVFADKHGNCVALGERDCSIQRRHQKILEESPAPHLREDVRQDIWEKARQAALAVGYEGAGTVEFIFDNETGDFFFMEMNTRLQVEHPVTEMVTGEDLVRWQLLVAEGGQLPLTQAQIEQRIAERGHAIEARIYAENPAMNFMPDSGPLLHLRTPTPSETVRIDSGFIAGDQVSSHYDPMISKLIVHGPTREAAIQKLHAALQDYEVAGPATNIAFLKRMCLSRDFLAGNVETGYIEKHQAELFAPSAPAPEVYAQAALALALQESHASAQSATALSRPPVTAVGFGHSTGFQHREYNLSSTPADGQSKGSSTDNSTTTTVSLRQTSPSHFDIRVGPTTTYTNVTATWTPSSNTLSTWYPHTRITSTLLLHSSSSSSSPPTITLFQHGTHHRLTPTPPRWITHSDSSTTTTAKTTHSVLAPMPCKILRVAVQPGDTVCPDQPLVVVESMKMEMVVRSPGHAVVRRVGHGAGELCKAGGVLVEFEEGGGGGGGGGVGI